jgi:hypothetical protein
VFVALGVIAMVMVPLALIAHGQPERWFEICPLAFCDAAPSIVWMKPFADVLSEERSVGMAAPLARSSHSRSWKN